MKGKSGREVFRPRRAYAILMGAAGAAWLLVLLCLTQFRGVAPKTYLSAGCFFLFFACSLLYYAWTAIFIDVQGVTYRGILGTHHFSFQEIRKVDVIPGPVTIYTVRGPRNLIHFSSFFLHHQRLLKLLVRSARLNP